MKQLKIYIAAMLVAILATGFASCSADDIEDFKASSDECFLVFDINLADSSIGNITRADQFEIDAAKAVTGELMESLRVIIINSDGYVEHNYYRSFEGALPNISSERFSVKGNDQKDVFMIANERYFSIADPENPGDRVTAFDYFARFMPGTMLSPDELKSLILYSQDNIEAWQDSSTRHLPISNYDSIYVTEESEQHRQYNLYRAATKYTFRIINLSDDELNLGAIYISNCADREYLFPTGTPYQNSFTDYTVPEGTDGSQEFKKEGLNITLPGGMKQYYVIPSCYMTEGVDMTTLPEENRTDYTTALEINGLRLDDVKVMWREVDSALPAQEMTDLPRNTHVVTTVTIAKDRKITCVAEVQPYTSVSLTPNFGLECDHDGNLIYRDRWGYLTDSLGNHIDAYGNKATLYVDEKTGEPVKYVDKDGYTLNKDGYPLDSDGMAGYRDETGGIVRSHDGYLMNKDGHLIDAAGNLAARCADGKVRDDNGNGYLIDYDGNLVDCDGLPAHKGADGKVYNENNQEIDKDGKVVTP